MRSARKSVQSSIGARGTEPRPCIAHSARCVTSILHVPWVSINRTLLALRNPADPGAPEAKSNPTCACAMGRMTRLVRPYISTDQARALIAAAEDRAFKMSLLVISYPHQGSREPALLAAAAAQLKEALAEREHTPPAACGDRRRD